MGKKGIYIFILYIMIHICGCGNIAQGDTVTTEELQTVKINRQDEKELRGENENTVIKHELWQEDQKASTVLEDEDFLYFCGKNNILKVGKETLEAEYIWESTQNQNNNDYAYTGTRGILADDKLYFIEEWTEDEDDFSTCSLSVVGTDGNGYERIESFETNPSEKENRLMLLDGILYYAVHPDSKAMEGYPVDKNGELLYTEKTTTEVKNVPEDYWEPYYYENGSRTLSALESEKRFGYYLLRDEDYELCIVDPVTGSKEELPAELKGYSLAAVNDDYFLFDSYAEEKILLVDTETLELRELGETDAYNSIITMDSDYVYFQRLHEGDSFKQYKYLRIDLRNGYKEEVFTVDAFSGMPMSSPWFFMDISLINNYIYYAGEQDYKLYLMRRNLDMPNAEEMLGEAFYDTGISQVGRLETYKETIYSTKKPDEVIATVELEWLVVDERFSGADAINKILEEEQPVYKEYIHENARQYDDWEDFDFPGFSFTSNVSPIYYMDGRYLSFVQQNYDYSGGAHGMPFWVAHTFDLDTGKELMLSDIIEGDDAVVKDVVTRYFTGMYNKEPDVYWDGAVDIVKEGASLQSPFYLSKDGIVFYYGPYELAPYAGGFPEVVIPYSEFVLKLDLQNELEENR